MAINTFRPKLVSLPRVPQRVPGYALAGLIACGAPIAVHAQRTVAADDSIAAAAFKDYATACPIGQHVWKLPVCGRLALVEPRSRRVFLSAAPIGAAFQQTDKMWVGQWPDTLSVANTSVMWNAQPWAVVRWPVPTDPASRLALLVHESFHSIQKAIGITERDAMSVHLDEANGRVWFRLEAAALGHALASSGVEARRHARNAAWMRRKRYSLIPGADTLERALEMSEGMAEYTGWLVATSAFHLSSLSVIENLRSFVGEPSLVRSFAYGTGPALGFLLDRFSPGWRKQLLTTRNPGAMLQSAVGANGAMPSDSALIATAEPYGYRRILREETARASARARMLADYQRRLVDGPVIEITDIVNRSYDPLTLVPFGANGTVYPHSASFSGAWGRVTVDSVGVLLSSDFNTLRLSRPSTVVASPAVGASAAAASRAGSSSTQSPLAGLGWVLELREGWVLENGSRSGDLRVVVKR